MWLEGLHAELRRNSARSPFEDHRRDGGLLRFVVQSALRDPHLECQICKAFLDDAILGEHREVHR